MRAGAGARGLLARVLAVALGLTLGLVLSELLARLVLGRGEYLPAGDVYRESPVPGVGYRLAPDFDGFALGARLSTNSLGFRGPDHPRAKPPDTTRIVLIGDSHAFGFGVDFDQTLGARLEVALNEAGRGSFEVLNLAVPGYNAAQQAAVFEHIALSFEPEAVVLVPASNDHEPAQEAGADGYLRTPRDDVEGEISEWAKALARRSRLFRFLRLLARRQEQRRLERRVSPHPGGAVWMGEIPAGPVDANLRASVGGPVERILDLAHVRGLRVVLAPFAGEPEYRRLFRGLAEEHDVPLVELLGVFPEVTSWEELQTRHGLGWDPHLGPEAHRRWSIVVGQALEREAGVGALTPPPATSPPGGRRRR